MKRLGVLISNGEQLFCRYFPTFAIRSSEWSVFLILNTLIYN